MSDFSFPIPSPESRQLTAMYNTLSMHTQYNSTPIFCSPRQVTSINTVPVFVFRISCFCLMVRIIYLCTFRLTFVSTGLWNWKLFYFLYIAYTIRYWTTLDRPSDCSNAFSCQRNRVTDRQPCLPVQPSSAGTEVIGRCSPATDRASQSILQSTSPSAAAALTELAPACVRPHVLLIFYLLLFRQTAGYDKLFCQLFLSYAPLFIVT